MEIGFPEALLLIGVLLMVAAGFSGLTKGTVLSISVLAVASGIGFAEAGIVSADPTSPQVTELIELALILTLFSDGMFAERELLQTHRALPARAIVGAMPITLGLIAVGAKALFDLNWAEAFLLAAVLTPTDPVVTSAVVTARSVPGAVRHTLNLESGLNDGLALPFVLFFVILSSPGGDPGTEGVKLVGEAAAGGVIGVLLGLAGGWMHDRFPGGGITSRYEGIFALGIGLAAYGVAEVTIGNGFIAAFVAGLALGAVERGVPDAFVEFNEGVSAIFQVLTFFVFGALIVETGFNGSLLPLFIFIPFVFLIARPVAIVAAFARSGLPRPQLAFVAWFGPKGVASMLFAIFALESQAPDRTIVFDIAAFVILASIVAHGLTDTIGANWIERRVSEEES